MPAVYLVNPRPGVAGYYNADVYPQWGLPSCVQIADLATVTVAAMFPSDFDVSICEEFIEPVDYQTTADFVAITGKVSQAPRMKSIAEAFRRRGKVVVIGGPYASLCPDRVRPWCDILVTGESEEIFSELVAGLRSGQWRDTYQGGRPELSTSPLPRWDLYPNDRALVGAVQTSRGCPFECEFCDVIQYLGRKQRFKSNAQVLNELDELYRHGYRTIYVCDDNFLVNRARARSLLTDMKAWNDRQTAGYVAFSTQTSIDGARDPDLLELAAAAGLTSVFIGIETPNEDSLRETHKRQNLKGDLLEQVQGFLDHGIFVTAGCIVGFDADGPDIFERQYQFAMASPIPIFTVGALVAPPATPLYTRLAQAGRLVGDGLEQAGNPWSTNITPLQMSREELVGRTQRLAFDLYTPVAFEARLLHFIERFGGGDRHRRSVGANVPRRPVDGQVADLLSNFSRLGPREAALWTRVMVQVRRKPETATFVLTALAQYMQIQCMYQGGDVAAATVLSQDRSRELVS